MEPFGRNIQTTYDRVAAEYAGQFYDELSGKPFDRALLDRYADLMRKRGPVCDLGCGPGHIARYLKDRDVHVFGLDLSASLLAHAARLSPDIAFGQANMRALPIADGALAGIAAFYSIIHLPRQSVPDALREFYRVLTPGGWLLLAFHGGEGEIHLDQWFDQAVRLDVSFFSGEEMCGYLYQAGFGAPQLQQRDPYLFEHPSQRIYLLAQKREQDGPLFTLAAHYDCPFCKVARGVGDAITHPSDIVYQDEFTTAFISPKWWPNNPGYVIIIPNQHYQDIFDLPPEVAAHIHRTAQKIGRAFIDLYGCDGISTRQHNGNYPMQEVMHFHFHVFPRYRGDQLYTLDDAHFRAIPEQRRSYADKLRAYLNDK